MKHYKSLDEIKSDLNTGSISCVELVEGYIANIESQKELNVFLEVFNDSAMKQAKLVDEKIKSNTAGKLAGMVIGLKDNICYKDHKVSASSKILEGFESLYNSTVVERLLQEDAILIGRLNCDEFAMGSSNENSAYGCVKNPLNPECVPGGSSGGSSAAVAANMCLATLGSDTGGSIRQPASFCGVVGLKPTYGRVSRWGLLAYGSSLDQIGPLTNSIEDCGLILEVIAGKDEYDVTASTKEVEAYSEFVPAKKKYRIARLGDAMNASGLNPEVKEKVEKVFDQLKADGHEVEEVSFPFLDKMVPTYYVISNAEASSNLSRYDGVHFGIRSESAKDVESTLINSRTDGFGEEVKRRIMLGTFVLSAGYYDAYYAKAQKVRRVISDKTQEILKDYDFIMLPTTPHSAFKIGENSTDPIAMYLEDIFTVQANLAGVPAISLPLNKDADGMPFGTQVIANNFQEKELLAFSKILMDSTFVN